MGGASTTDVEAVAAEHHLRVGGGQRRSSTKNRVTFLDISVCNPRQQKSIRGKYTEYEVVVKTNFSFFSTDCSVSLRRYSEFEWLRDRLMKDLQKDAPKLPDKYVMNRFDSATVEERRAGLQDFLRL